MATVRTLVLLPLLALLALGGGTVGVSAEDDTGCSKVTIATSPSVAQNPRYTLQSHDFSTQKQYSHNMSCTWNISAPAAGSTWLVIFDDIELEVSSSPVPCRFDSLTVSYQLSGRQLSTVLCGNHSDLSLVPDGSFRLTFKTDISLSYGGFKISWKAVREEEAVRLRTRMSPVFLVQGSPGSCGSLKSSGSPTRVGHRSYPVTQIKMSSRSYIHNADCTWTVPVEGNNAIYLTLDKVMLESSPGCAADGLTVIYRLSRLSQSQRRVLCWTNGPITLVSRDAVTLQLRTDSTIGSELSIKWFVAPVGSPVGDFRTSALFQEEQCPVAVNGTNGGSIRMYFDSPLTYDPRTRCSWIVSVPAGKVADFNFTKFDLARGYRYMRYPYRLYNSTRINDYCAPDDDTVTIAYSSSRYYGTRRSLFCYNSNVRLGRVAVSGEGEVTVAFRSNGDSRTGHGFILEYRIRDKETRPSAACPSVQRVDKYHQVIKASSQESSVIRDGNCAWILNPPGASYLMSLNITLSGDSMDDPFPYPREYMGNIFSGIPPIRFRPMQSVRCHHTVFVTSQRFVGKSALLLPRDGSQASAVTPRSFQRELCPPVTNVIMSYFAGPVNVSISSRMPQLDIQGLTVAITTVPKPQPGCFTTTVTTSYTRSQTIKVITITGQAGCIASESVFGKDTNLQLVVTKVSISHQLTCSQAASNEVLKVLSGSYAMSIGCGSTANTTVEEEQPMILVFPERTGAVLVSRVTYEFPFDHAYCQALNGQPATGDNSIGSFLLPLFIDPSGLYGRGARFISCNYKLAYRPGYSIRLGIHHNLGYEDLDFFCHAKTLNRDISPHIVLTTMERDTDYPDTMMETQLEMCHGHSVGSLGTKSDLLIDGSVSIRLLALRFDQRALDNITTVMDALHFMQLLNSTLPQQLRFSLTYEYVPACPKFTCRSPNASKSGCSPDDMSKWILEAALLPNSISQSCKWTFPNDAGMRSALASQSNVWLLKLEVGNFSVGCPCHGCEVDDFQEFISVGQLSTGAADYLPERIVLCGDHRSSSKAVFMPVGPGQPDVRIAYSPIETGASLRATFVDCQNSPGLEQCKVALQQRLMAQPMRLDSASHGGKIFVTLLLVAILIGCLLYMNRETLISSGARLQERLRARRPPLADDMLQLNPETERAH